MIFRDHKGFVAHVCVGGPIHEIVVRGKTVRFEMHPYCGPVLIGKNGEPLKNQPDNERHPFWPAFERWQKQQDIAHPTTPTRGSDDDR